MMKIKTAEETIKQAMIRKGKEKEIFFPFVMNMIEKQHKQMAGQN